MPARLARSTLARLTPATPRLVAALPRATASVLAVLASPAFAQEEPAAADAAAQPVAQPAAQAATQEDWSGGPRYSYFDAGYQWIDVNYAVKQEGGQHEGFKLNGSVGLAEFGRVGLHLFGEFFDGDFSGVRTACDGAEGQTSFDGDRDSQSVAGGLGVSYAIVESTDIVGRVAYVDITEFELPNSSCQVVSGDDSGYFVEGMIRSEMSENVELEAGVRYSDLKDSDIANTDVVLGIGYHVTDYFTLRARGVVFDDDTGLEISARLYFGSFLGRDRVF